MEGLSGRGPDGDCRLHLGRVNLDAALALMDEIQGNVEQLQAHPKRCRPGRVKGTRELVVRPNYIVVYAETPASVMVLRVLHAAQMWP